MSPSRIQREGLMVSQAVAVLQHDAGAVAGAGDRRGALAQLDQPHPGVTACGVGVF